MSRQAPMALTHGSQASAGCPSPPLSQPHRRHHHRQQQQQQQQEERSPGPPDPQPEWATADRNPPGSRSAIAVRMYIVRTSCGCGLVSCPPSQPSSVSRTYRRREKAKKRRTQKARRTDEPHRQGSQQRPRPRPQQSLHGCVGHPPPRARADRPRARSCWVPAASTASARSGPDWAVFLFFSSRARARGCRTEASSLSAAAGWADLTRGRRAGSASARVRHPRDRPRRRPNNAGSLADDETTAPRSCPRPAGPA